MLAGRPARSGEFLHHDPVALDFVQVKLDRCRCLGRRHDRAKDFALGAQQDDAPAAFHPAGELARRVFGGAAAGWHRRENRASRRQCLIVNRPSTIRWQRSPTVQRRRAEISPMDTMLTLGAAARHLGVSKGTISKAIATGKLSATRREDGSWAIDGSELARYLEVNGHRFRSETIPSEQVATEAELRARADLAEQRLADLRSMYEDMKAQRDKWETVAQRLSLPAPKPVETPETAPPPPSEQPSRLRRTWRWLRSTG